MEYWHIMTCNGQELRGVGRQAADWFISILIATMLESIVLKEICFIRFHFHSSIIMAVVFISISAGTSIADGRCGPNTAIASILM